MWSSHSGTTHVSNDTMLSLEDTLQYSTRLASLRLLQALSSVNTLKCHICRTHDSLIIIWVSSHIPHQNHKKFMNHIVWHVFPEVYYFLLQFKHSPKQSINISHQNTHSLTDNGHVYLSVHYSFPPSAVVSNPLPPLSLTTSKTNITTNFPTTNIAYTVPPFRETKQLEWWAEYLVHLVCSDI